MEWWTLDVTMWTTWINKYNKNCGDKLPNNHFDELQKRNKIKYYKKKRFMEKSLQLSANQ